MKISVWGDAEQQWLIQSPETPVLEQPDWLV
jgi:hypothetical protein